MAPCPYKQLLFSLEVSFDGGYTLYAHLATGHDQTAKNSIIGGFYWSTEWNGQGPYAIESVRIKMVRLVLDPVLEH